MSLKLIVYMLAVVAVCVILPLAVEAGEMYAVNKLSCPTKLAAKHKHRNYSCDGCCKGLKYDKGEIGVLNCKCIKKSTTKVVPTDELREYNEGVGGMIGVYSVKEQTGYKQFQQKSKKNHRDQS